VLDFFFEPEVLDISYAQIDLVITHVIQLRTSHRIYLLVWFGKTTGFGLEGAAIGSIPILVASCWCKWPALCWFDLIKKITKFYKYNRLLWVLISVQNSL
jgi:hypothetical protein